MPQSDLPLANLRSYAPELAVPTDLDRFWSTTLAEARAHDLSATFEPVDSGLAVISTFDVSYSGFGGSPVRAWLHLPAGRQGPLPAAPEGSHEAARPSARRGGRGLLRFNIGT